MLSGFLVCALLCVRCVRRVHAFVWVYMCAFMYVCMPIICVLRCKVVGSDTTAKSLLSVSEPLNSHLRYVMAMLNVSNFVCVLYKINEWVHLSVVDLYFLRGLASSCPDCLC